MISPGVFFIFSGFWFFGLLRGWRCKEWSKMAKKFYAFSPRHRNTGLVSSGVSLTSCRGASLALVGHPSTDDITIKIPYEVDILLCFIVRPVETGLGRWMLVVAVISADAYPFFGFLRPDPSPWGYRHKRILVALRHLIVRRQNLEVVTKRLLHQQVKIPG